MERNLLYNKLVTNIKETMMMNDDKSRHSLSGGQVAVGDVAPGRPSFTVTGRSRVIAECSGVSLLTCSSLLWSLGVAGEEGGWMEPLMMVGTLSGRCRRWWHLDFISNKVGGEREMVTELEVDNNDDIIALSHLVATSLPVRWHLGSESVKD